MQPNIKRGQSHLSMCSMRMKQELSRIVLQAFLVNEVTKKPQVGLDINCNVGPAPRHLDPPQPVHPGVVRLVLCGVPCSA